MGFIDPKWSFALKFKILNVSSKVDFIAIFSIILH